MKAALFSMFLFVSAGTGKSQSYPAYGKERDVAITGLTFDAMEPFISPDGNILFFNNLNDGVDTKIYYATKVNDSVFTLIGELNGTNQTTASHLDAVSDIDSLNNFYWTSTRNYPVDLDNLFHGSFSSGHVTETGRVRGNFNKNIPGWLVMDHCISLDGQQLYYNNARLNGAVCTGPCETEIGIAQKLNDSTFNKLPNTDSILKNINDTNYICYAPCISSDNLELYYTRYPKREISSDIFFEICVAVRSSITDAFSLPKVLISDVVEAPTLTTDKKIMYYHRKTVDSHIIVMRYREEGESVIKHLCPDYLSFKVYPNPVSAKLTIEGFEFNSIVTVFDLKGVIYYTNTVKEEELILDTQNWPKGIYVVQVKGTGNIINKKLVKE